MIVFLTNQIAASLIFFFVHHSNYCSSSAFSFFLGWIFCCLGNWSHTLNIYVYICFASLTHFYSIFFRLEFESQCAQLNAQLDFEENQLEQDRKKLSKMKDTIHMEEGTIAEHKKVIISGLYDELWTSVVFM